MKKHLVLFMFLLFSGSIAFGQLTPQKVALTAHTGMGGIGVSYNLDESLRLNGNLGLSFGKDVTNISLGAGIWKYHDITGDLDGYVGGGFGFNSTSYNGSSTNSFGLNGVYGAEYWIAPSFSANVHAIVYLDLSPNFGLKFATEAGASWWFK